MKVTMNIIKEKVLIEVLLKMNWMWRLQKSFVQCDAYKRHEINIIQNKNIIGTYMVSLSCYDDKKYLKTDTIGYGFINLLINHAKIISSSIDNLF